MTNFDVPLQGFLCPITHEVLYDATNTTSRREDIHVQWRRISGSDTAKKLGMKDNDILDYIPADYFK